MRVRGFTMADQTPNETSPTPTSVECSAAKDPAVRLFIVAGMALGAGIYCGVDHFIRKMYPYPDPYELNAYLKYIFNHYGTFVFSMSGIILFVWAIVFLRRKLVADEEGIGYVGKEKISWNSVISLDSSQLADKGVLRLVHKAGGGQKTLKLCSWKLQNFRSLVLLLENKAPLSS